MTDEEQREMDFRVFMAETVIYRKEQAARMDRMSQKIDNIFDKLDSLPCKERSAIYSTLSGQLRAIWIFVSALVVGMIASFWGHINGKG